MRVQSRGINLIEILLATCVLLVAFVFVITAFSGSARQAIQSRNRKLAILTAQSWLDEVRAHDFGKPAPASWPINKPGLETYRFVVSGKEQLAEFPVEMTFENGSLIGKGLENFDRVTIVVRWEETLSGDAQSQQRQRELNKVKAELLIAKSSFALEESP